MSYPKLPTATVPLRAHEGNAKKKDDEMAARARSETFPLMPSSAPGALHHDMAQQCHWRLVARDAEGHVGDCWMGS